MADTNTRGGEAPGGTVWVRMVHGVLSEDGATDLEQGKEYRISAHFARTLVGRAVQIEAPAMPSDISPKGETQDTPVPPRRGRKAQG